MKKIFKLGNKVINEKNPTYIIAEVGVNHNGDINIARKLIKEAKLAGADCIKFQTFSSSKLVSKTASKAKYQKLTTNNKETQYSMLKNLELSKDDHIKLLNFCKKEKITFLSTPYNFDDVDFLDKIGVSGFKLASMHLTEHFYLQYISKKINLLSYQLVCPILRMLNQQSNSLIRKEFLITPCFNAQLIILLLIMKQILM